jgi:Holliday junction resolvase RusA-like endonuclease
MEGIRAIRTKTGKSFTQTYPTQEYKDFLERFKEATKDLTWNIESEAKLKITIWPYFSNKASDLDNVAKPSLDALQQVFKWNDKYCYEIHMFKSLVKKGEERLVIEIEELKEI